MLYPDLFSLPQLGTGEDVLPDVETKVSSQGPGDAPV
jgi:hypothetical protein